LMVDNSVPHPHRLTATAVFRILPETPHRPESVS
jgi:hypothetical protein